MQRDYLVQNSFIPDLSVTVLCYLCTNFWSDSNSFVWAEVGAAGAASGATGSWGRRTGCARNPWGPFGVSPEGATPSSPRGEDCRGRSGAQRGPCLGSAAAAMEATGQEIKVKEIN